MTNTVQPTPDYLLHFTVEPAGKDFNLKIESQWWGARERNSLQTKFDVTLPYYELKQLALAIEEGSKK